MHSVFVNHRFLYLYSVIIFLAACQPADFSEDGGIKFDIPEDFELEQLYAPTENDQGSWVSLAEDPDGRFFACDQYGGIYTFAVPEIGASLTPVSIDSVPLNIGYAQGLLWAFNSLYVVVVKEVDEERPEDPSSGVYRLWDSTNDGQLDQIKKILTVNGTGEHGPHTLRVGPDGNTLYFIAGNFNDVPDHFKSRLPRNWQEDNLFPPYPDARGHAVDLKAPGGWLARTDPEGNEWELIGAGMRNPFSFGLNRDGELFAYDADMEWDFGMPWYRPTRILHITSGSEYGWRTGSGKWPVFYPDNLPPVEDMAQGSPTAVIMGKDLQFPSRYRDGLFACDWSFGTIYYVDLEESGSSYAGKKEEFLSGVPLPITNAIAGSDGHLYFTTGGRRLNSHFYRLRYTGNESTEISEEASQEAESLRAKRHELESFHSGTHPNAVPASWPYLNHEDRFIQYAARIAIEHQPLEKWQDQLWNEEDPETLIQAGIAYARVNGPINRRIIQKLLELDWSTLSERNKIGLLRSVELLLIRNRDEYLPYKDWISGAFNDFYPSNSPQINRLLGQILLYLEAPGSTEKTIALLKRESESATSSHPELIPSEITDRSEQYGPKIAAILENMPPTEAIHYATLLSHVKSGWTRDLRTQYFQWFHNALSKEGGESYKAFLDNIRAAALENTPAEEQKYFKSIAGFYSPIRSLAELPQPKGPGRNYNLMDIGGLVIWGGDKKLREHEGTFEDGVRAYGAALCSACHRLNGNGGGAGPDLTNVHTRFGIGDIANAIISPNEEISDQYAFSTFNLKSNEILAGRILEETDSHYKIYQSPYDVTRTSEIAKSDVVSTVLSPISPMPAKLLNQLNENEVKDLFKFLAAGGDPEHEFYQ